MSRAVTKIPSGVVVQAGIADDVVTSAVGFVFLNPFGEFGEPRCFRFGPFGGIGFVFRSGTFLGALNGFGSHRNDVFGHGIQGAAKLAVRIVLDNFRVLDGCRVHEGLAVGKRAVIDGVHLIFGPL